MAKITRLDPAPTEPLPVQGWEFIGRKPPVRRWD